MSEPLVGGSGKWPLPGQPGNPFGEQQVPPLLAGFDKVIAPDLHSVVADARDLQVALDDLTRVLYEACLEPTWSESAAGHRWEPARAAAEPGQLRTARNTQMRRYVGHAA